MHKSNYSAVVAAAIVSHTHRHWRLLLIIRNNRDRRYCPGALCTENARPESCNYRPTPEGLARTLPMYVNTFYISIVARVYR